MKRAILPSTSAILAAIAALAAITIVVVASGNSAAAASSLVNGNFETGNLTGWTVDTTASGGDAGAVTSYCPYYQEPCTGQSGGVFPKEGSYFALLQPSGAFTSEGVFEDAIISQSFEASNGDRVSGWAFFRAEDWTAGEGCYAGLPYCGWNAVWGQVVITSDSGTTVATPFQQGYSRQTAGGDSGWVYWEHTFTDLTGEGSFQLEARTRDNYSMDSHIGLDDVKMTTGGPDTTIGSTKPTDPTKNTSASFSFSSSESNSTFQCKLDSGSYESCSSPKQYTGLAQGSHTFSVKAIDQAGHEDLTAAIYTWTVDTTAPTISSVYPANGATGAVRNTDISARFSEKMDPATLTTSTVTLVKYGTTTPISAKVFYDNYYYNAVNLSRPSYLTANTKYTVKIKGGTNGVKDLAGNQLGSGNQTSGDYWWTFTTGNLPRGN
jgi:Bacterial Ig-like domain